MVLFSINAVASISVLAGVSQINADCFPDEVEYHGKCYYFGRVSEVVNHDLAHVSIK